jgi:hypothetical protein
LFVKNLNSAISSGAIDEKDILEWDVIFIKAVLYLTAQDVKPFSDTGKQMLKNLQYFI